MKTKNIALAVVLGLVMSSGTLSAAGKKIVMEGSTTVLPIAQIAAEEFMKMNPEADITVRGGGSGVGAASLIDKSCDIANMSRAMKDTEVQKAVGRGVEPKAHVVAMDGIAVILNPSNPIKSFTRQQVKDIYTGKISNWSKLGGEDKKIVVVSRDSASGTYEAFGALALGGAKLRKDALMQASNQAVANTVGATPNGIGYVGLGYITDKVKAVPVAGVTISKTTVLTAKYPYSRPLFMYTNGAPQGDVKDFFDFLLSADGQKLVDEAGFVALKEKK